MTNSYTSRGIKMLQGMAGSADVAGVYLILAQRGCAVRWGCHGTDGIWGPGPPTLVTATVNRMLKDLIDRDTNYPKEFLYSNPSDLAEDFCTHEVLKWEQRYKDKLGSLGSAFERQLQTA